MFDYFYNETLRKITLAFGGLFDEIYIEKKTPEDTIERVRVPLTYSSKEKFIRRLNEASSISNNVKIETYLPKMSFSMVNMGYDVSRKVNKVNRKFKVTGTGENSKTYQGFTEVPYNVQFEVGVYTRNVEDNLQIIEQIIPYFSPEFIVTLKMNKLDTHVDVPIVLTGINFTDTYDGDFLTRRMVTSNLNFIAKAHVFAKVLESGSGIIKEVDVNVFEDDEL
jgi:hypothetical protein